MFFTELLLQLASASPRLARAFGEKWILAADRPLRWQLPRVDAWLSPDYRYFKLKGVDGDTYLVRHDERFNTWELTMFRAERVDGP
ncbi:MAG: hypothetical protein DMF84_11775 [Acidobacteria bacterium]|nr:MAG: hypothetical protein DMF84_11775 [Acidobacteriota bacterium]